MKKILIVMAVLAVVFAVCFFVFQKNNESEKTMKTEGTKENVKNEKIEESEEESEENDAIETENYDVVIVGAGMAGLSAAYNLTKIDKNLKILILEKNARIGGRAYHKKTDDFTYSLGPCFGYHQMMLPTELKSKHKIFFQNAPKGVYYDDKLSLKDYSKQAFDELTGGKKPLNAHKFLNFTVHFEGMENIDKHAFYKPDGYFDFDLISYYESLFAEKTSLKSEVLSVKSKGDNATVVYMKEGRKFKTSAKAVIVATPATVAKKIIRNLPENTQKFLNSVKYSKTKILALVYKKTNDLAPFSYINMEPKYDFWRVDRYFLNNPNYAFYTIYSHKLVDSSDEDFFEQSLNFLNKIGIGNFVKENIVKYEIVVWDKLVTNYCEDSSTDCEMSFVSRVDICAGVVDKCINNPVDKVFLAGDYALLYGGVFSAWLSGRNAANRAGRSLGFKTDSSDISIKKK